MSSSGVEPDLRPSQSRVLSLTLQGLFSELDYPTEESNLARLLRRQSCILHTRGAIAFHQRADDWIRTSIDLFTGQAPFSVEPRRQKQKSLLHKREDSNPGCQFWRLTALRNTLAEIGFIVDVFMRTQSREHVLERPVGADQDPPSGSSNRVKGSQPAQG